MSREGEAPRSGDGGRLVRWRRETLVVRDVALWNRLELEYGGLK
jgi:hypothetical protein